MYQKFFGLTRSPFEISPDPYFYYGSAKHNEALASIYYGIRARKGFVERKSRQQGGLRLFHSSVLRFTRLATLDAE